MRATPDVKRCGTVLFPESLFDFPIRSFKSFGFYKENFVCLKVEAFKIWDVEDASSGEVNSRLVFEDLEFTFR